MDWKYNTLVMDKPNEKNMMSANCNTSCKPIGHADPTYADCLGQRKNRDVVREQMRVYILGMLGAPVIEIELDEQQIDIAIDQALMIFEEYAGTEYFSYYTFETNCGQSIYELPCDIGFVRSVSYKELPRPSFLSQELGGSIPLEYFYQGGSQSRGDGGIMGGGIVNPMIPMWGRQGEWYQYKQYERLYSKLSSNTGGFEFIGDSRTIKLYPIPRGNFPVAVHYIEKNKDWIQVNQAMQEGALSYAKEMLGRIRSKFQTLPGAGGGVVMDGQSLIQEAQAERQKWMEDLIYKFGDLPNITWG